MVVLRLQDFSTFPFGRYPRQGMYNGERYRKEILMPALQRDEVVEVDLDGTRGLAPSFVEEAFGGLVRAGVPAEVVKARIVIRSSDDPSWIAEVRKYVEDAAQQTAR